MPEDLVSIIVPIYNQEKQLNDCLNSIVKQTYCHTELLLIDDGSSDSSGRICDKYALEDKRIKVFHTTHKGVGAARNLGLSKANGTYIQFIDGDDFVISKATKTLINTMKRTEADLVVCGYTKLIYHLKVYNERLEQAGAYSNQEYLCNTLIDPGDYYYGVVWNKLYKAEVIKQNQILFSPTVTLGEDFIFTLEYLKHIKKVQVIQDKLYYYNCENEQSLSRKRKKTIEDCKEELRNRKEIYKYYKNCFQQLGLYQEKKAQVNQYWLMYYIRNLGYLRREFKNWPDPMKEEWKKILNNDNDIKLCLKYISKEKYLIIKIRIELRTSVVSVIKRFSN
ncbi:MAG: glycosyltransferase [bacterium]|nr:glycosyltransferase [bacterium]